jgi:hypothetical protein
MATLSELHHFGLLKGQVTLSDMDEKVLMKHAPMRYVRRCNYDAKANAENPAFAWPDAIVDGVVLHDAMQLQMFETFVSSNPQICAYDCHIAPKGAYREYKDDPDNFVYASWDFITTLMV